MNFMLKDPNSGQPSTTRTVFFIGCLVCISKLAFSGLITKLFQLPQFSGSDFGMAIGALGSIYALDKHVSSLNQKDGKE
jgi:hypothetical protein